MVRTNHLSTTKQHEMLSYFVGLYVQCRCPELVRNLSSIPKVLTEGELVLDKFEVNRPELLKTYKVYFPIVIIGGGRSSIWCASLF